MRLRQVDAFTGKAFAGNPAAVCLLDEPRDATWMQDVRTDFRAYQCSTRGGVVHVRLEGDRVRLGGQAVTVLRGELVS